MSFTQPLRQMLLSLPTENPEVQGRCGLLRVAVDRGGYPILPEPLSWAFSRNHSPNTIPSPHTRRSQGSGCPPGPGGDSGFGAGFQGCC